MGVRLAVAGTVVLLLLYLALAVQYAVVLLASGQPLGVALGVALLVLPLLAGWGLVAEILFAVRAERLGARLDAAGKLPADELPVRPSGRLDPAAAAELFPAFRAAVEAAPEDAVAWFRLGLAYDAAGDRRRARWATRQAIRLDRAVTPAS